MKEKTTDMLDGILQNASVADTDRYLNEQADKLYAKAHPFAAYMRERIRAKGLKQQDVFLAADISDGYGYKLISEEKHTLKRDTILRLCFGAHFTLDEMNKALKLYGFSPLYGRVPRDAVLTIACNNEMYEIADVNELLARNQMESLAPCSGE